MDAQSMFHRWLLEDLHRKLSRLPRKAVMRRWLTRRQIASIEEACRDRDRGDLLPSRSSTPLRDRLPYRPSGAGGAPDASPQAGAFRGSVQRRAAGRSLTRRDEEETWDRR